MFRNVTPIKHVADTQAILSDANLANVMRAMHASFDAEWDAALLEDLWALFGADGLANLFKLGLRLSSVWSSITSNGHLDDAAMAGADMVTKESCVVGVYLDCGEPRMVVRKTYAGSSHRTTVINLPDSLKKVWGVAARVLAEHESKKFRDDSDPKPYHYTAGYSVSPYFPFL